MGNHILKWSPWIVFFSLILALVSARFTVKLYQNLKTDFEELLPTQSRSVRDLARVENRMESTESLAVLVFSDHPDDSKRFVDDLATAIERELPELASHVEYRITAEMRFFKQRRALMMDLADLKKVQRYIDDRLQYEQDIRNPLNIFSGATINPPALDLKALTGKYEGRVADYAKFKDGYYATPDGKIRAILVYLSGRALGVASALKLRKGVDQIVARLKPTSYAPDLTVKFTGDVQNLIEERDSVIHDLMLSTMIVAVLVIVAMIIYFRDLQGTIALVVSLFTGTLWTFGAAYFAVGYLNANSAFLGSIVLGNGINFGIILLARYLEERVRLDHANAILAATKGALPGTLTAALAAGLAYGSLGLTTFRGFRQFGVIGLMGMALCWTASFTLLPALLTLFERFWPRKDTKKAGRSRHGFAFLASRTVARFPRGILAVALGLTLVLGVLASRHRGPILETNTTHLRDRKSMKHGSGYLSRYLDQMFGRYLSPLVVLPETRAQTQEIGAKIKALIEQQGPSSLISRVYSIDEFVPPDQLEKIEILRQIRHELSPNIMRQLSPEDARLVRESLTPEAFRPFTVKELPPLIQARFRERDGSIGKPVLVEPVFKGNVMDQFENQKKFVDDVRSTADSVDPESAVVGQLPLTVDMIGSISHDGPRATLFAFLAVMVLAVVLFRRPTVILQSVLVLLLGVVWMSCAALALNLKVNFLNFIALPITCGIGMDYGVNLLARIRKEGTERIVDIVATTGGAVSLASLTTIIGYGSLLLAGNQGFVSFGRTAILGEITCLTAAIFVLPAFLRRRRPKAPSQAAQQGAAEQGPSPEKTSRAA